MLKVTICYPMVDQERKVSNSFFAFSAHDQLEKSAENFEKTFPNETPKKT